jgi:hypothetical protein
MTMTVTIRIIAILIGSHVEELLDQHTTNRQRRIRNECFERKPNFSTNLFAEWGCEEWRTSQVKRHVQTHKDEIQIEPKD